MTRDQIEKLLEVIDAKITARLGCTSSDGGLIDSIREAELVDELLAMADEVTLDE